MLVIWSHLNSDRDPAAWAIGPRAGINGRALKLRSEDRDVLQDDGFDGFIAIVAFNASNLFDDVEPFDDFAEDGMAIVEVGRWDFGDEELRTIGVGACICHRKDTRRIVTEFRREFIAELIPWAACSRSAWATALNHEIGNDAMERQSIVERTRIRFAEFFIHEFDLARSKSDEIFDSIGDDILIKFGCHIAKRRFKTRIEFAIARNCHV